MKQDPFFDADWYLQNYPDVAAAGVDPYVHYDKYGKKEGRLPCSLPSLPIERDLWANAETPDNHIGSLVEQAGKDTPNGLYASKVLAEFYLFKQQADKALHYIRDVLSPMSTSYESGIAPNTFQIAVEAMLQLGDKRECKALLDDPRWPESSGKQLARVMCANDDRKVSQLSDFYKKYGLAGLETCSGPTLLDSVIGHRQRSLARVLKAKLFTRFTVSVIVPVYNAEHTLNTALRSLCQQTWQALDIIVIDDCSRDDSLAVAQKLAAEDSRIRVESNTSNLGAYRTRNRGWKIATGRFVTVMDADDWAHPQKIEKQLIPFMLRKPIVASASHWVRCTDDMCFQRLRAGQDWVHRNVSSLLVLRNVVEELAGWDEVKVNADTEFYFRLIAQYGENAVKEVSPGLPLSLGRVASTSLTQSGQTHLVTQYGGVRKTYIDFAKVWHSNSQRLAIHSNAEDRPFPIPPGMMSAGSASATKKNEAEFKRWQAAMDEHWYLTAYTDVDRRGIGLHEHFWSQGEREGRAPSPLFCPAAYQMQEKIPSHISPTWQALKNGWNFGMPVKLSGHIEAAGKFDIALFAHSLSAKLFGAERSLLDMARACARGGFRVTLFLPSADNSTFIEEIRQYVCSIVFVPLPWVRGTRKRVDKIVDYLTEKFHRAQFSAIYINTLTLLEPYIAAKRAGIPAITHLRELPEFDADLRTALQESPSESRKRLLELSTFFIANSNETAYWINSPNNVRVVYNCVTTQAGDRTPFDDDTLRVCMLSSNIKKKGVDDFFDVARRSSENGDSNIQFTLYGPVTSDVKAAIKKYGENGVTIAGYVESPSFAINQNDVVLALSSFKESFGRTVAEAMMLGRVVVGYRWGAVGELVDEKSGVLVDYQNTEQVSQALQSLANDKPRYAAYSTSAASRANARFSPENFDKRLKLTLESFIKSVDKSDPTNLAR